MNDATLVWWKLLCAVSLLNIGAWAFSALRVRRHAATLHAPARRAMRLQLLLSAGYVAGCAYRSAFPVYDVGRLCLVDSWLSSVLVGRSVATLAELCFAAQWWLMLRDIALAGEHRPGLRVARLVMPMIVLAELCSWHAVLTTSNLGHVLEESLWAGCAALLVASLLLVWPRCSSAVRPVLAGAVILGVAYVLYMFQFDVPMYWARWLAEAQRGHAPLTLAQGLADAGARWTVSHRWDDWRSEVVWMTLYFSVAVWLSIGLVHLPARLRHAPLPARPA